MTDPFDFETRFEARLAAHADRATKPFDPAAIASRVAAAAPRRDSGRLFARILAGRDGRLSTMRVVLVGLLLLAAVGVGTVLVGAVLRSDPPIPDSLVQVTPSAAPPASAAASELSGPAEPALRGTWLADASPLPSLHNGAGPVSLSIDASGKRLSVANFAPGASFGSTTEQLGSDQIRMVLDLDSGGCSAGTDGRYGSKLSPDGLLLTLTPLLDRCVSRSEALGRTWARSLVGTATRGAGVVDTMKPAFSLALPDDTYESRVLPDFIEIGGAKGTLILLVFKNPQGFVDPCSTDQVRYPYKPGALAFVDFYRQNPAYTVESADAIRLDGLAAIHMIVKIKPDGPCPEKELYTWTPKECDCHFLGADDSMYLIDVGSDTFLFLLSPSPDQATETRVMESIRIPYEVPSQ